MLVGGHLQGWFPLTELPWNLPAERDIFAGPPPSFDGTSSLANQFAMSLISGISAGRTLSFQYNLDNN